MHDDAAPLRVIMCLTFDHRVDPQEIATAKAAIIACPSVLWQGNADHVVPAGVAFMLGASLPGCSVRRLDGQGHFWVLEHVGEVLETVSAFPA